MLRAGIPATIYSAIQTTQEVLFQNLLPVLPEKLDRISSHASHLVLDYNQIYPVHNVASFPGSPGTQICIAWRRQRFACCSTNYASTLGVYDIQCPIARYM